MFIPTVLTLIIHVEVWMVDVYTTVLKLIIHVEVWVVGVYTHTVLTLIIHAEVWVVGVYTQCTYTDHSSRGLGCSSLHPLNLR